MKKQPILFQVFVYVVIGLVSLGFFLNSLTGLFRPPQVTNYNYLLKEEK